MSKKSISTMEGMIESALQFLQDPLTDAVAPPGTMPKDADPYAALPTRSKPKAFQDCSGIVILEAIQVGFLFSAQMGTGILLRHDQATNTWSPPLAIGLTGVGAGLVMGAEKKQMIIFLSGDQMTKAMSSDFSIRLGVENSYSIGYGEVGQMTAQVGNQGGTATSGEGTTKGFYTGAQIEGTALAPRTAINEKFYGKKLDPKEILFGKPEDIEPECATLKRLQHKLFDLSDRKTYDK